MTSAWMMPALALPPPGTSITIAASARMMTTLRSVSGTLLLQQMLGGQLAGGSSASTDEPTASVLRPRLRARARSDSRRRSGCGCSATAAKRARASDAACARRRRQSDRREPSRSPRRAGRSPRAPARDRRCPPAGGSARTRGASDRGCACRRTPGTGRSESTARPLRAPGARPAERRLFRAARSPRCARSAPPDGRASQASRPHRDAARARAARRSTVPMQTIVGRAGIAVQTCSRYAQLGRTEHGQVDHERAEPQCDELFDRHGAGEHALLPATCANALLEDMEEAAVAVDDGEAERSGPRSLGVGLAEGTIRSRGGRAVHGGGESNGRLRCRHTLPWIGNRRFTTSRRLRLFARTASISESRIRHPRVSSSALTVASRSGSGRCAERDLHQQRRRMRPHQRRDRPPRQRSAARRHVQVEPQRHDSRRRAGSAPHTEVVVHVEQHDVGADGAPARRRVPRRRAAR